MILNIKLKIHVYIEKKNNQIMFFLIQNEITLLNYIIKSKQGLFVKNTKFYIILVCSAVTIKIILSIHECLISHHFPLLNPFFSFLMLVDLEIYKIQIITTRQVLVGRNSDFYFLLLYVCLFCLFDHRGNFFKNNS